MKKLHNKRAAAGLEMKLLKKLPKWTLASMAIPAFMSLLVRFPVIENLFASNHDEIVLLHNRIDFLGISLTLTILPLLLALAIGCFIVMIMKGPAYVADAYPLEDADKPDEDKDR